MLSYVHILSNYELKMQQWLYHEPKTKITGVQKLGKVFIETFMPFI